MDPSLIPTILIAVVTIALTILFGIPIIIKPTVQCDPSSACLYRCLTRPLFDQGWGIFEVKGKLRVSHKPVTVVDAKLSYEMDQQYTKGKELKPMGETFPPLHFFERVSNDKGRSTCSFARQGFTTIALSPGGGEKPFSIQFTLGGNFAATFSRLFFDGELCTIEKMFFPLRIRFEYEHNGNFYWTDDFDVNCHEFSNMGWTPDGGKWIHADGTIADVIYGPVVYGGLEIKND
jgi:hypothetical protein